MKKIILISFMQFLALPLFANTSFQGFYPPLSLYDGIEYLKKGVTFKFHEKREVRAPKDGVVVYVGMLSDYGNVVIIDHGNDTRAVLLGAFNYIVKNGDAVRDAQIVGYTNPKLIKDLSAGKIYFEVRKNGVAQNTFLLLDKRSLLKNVSNDSEYILVE